MKKGLIITVSIVTGLVILAFTIRGINLNRKVKEQPEEINNLTEASTEEVDVSTEEVLTSTTQPYKPDISGELEEDKAIIKRTTSYEYEPFILTLEKWSTAYVPDTLVNGSSFIKYYEALTPEMFDFSFGTELTEKDATASIQYCIGTSISPSLEISSDYLHNMHWLYNKLDFLEDNISINFTNLHVVGQVGSDMTLCMFDWDSVTTLNDAMVLVKGITGYNRGDVLSFATYRHNISYTVVNAQRVLLVDYRKEY